MAFDAFIKIDGIEGESADDQHQTWIELISYNTGVTQTVSSTASSSGGASAERADFQDFSITKQLDKATPKLAVACADGTHIDTILVELCRAGTEKIKFMEYKMTNCIIGGVSTNGWRGFPHRNREHQLRQNRMVLYPAKTPGRRCLRQRGRRLGSGEKLQGVT